MADGQLIENIIKSRLSRKTVNSTNRRLRIYSCENISRKIPLHDSDLALFMFKFLLCMDYREGIIKRRRHGSDKKIKIFYH